MHPTQPRCIEGRGYANSDLIHDKNIMYFTCLRIIVLKQWEQVPQRFHRRLTFGVLVLPFGKFPFIRKPDAGGPISHNNTQNRLRSQLALIVSAFYKFIQPFLPFLSSGPDETNKWIFGELFANIEYGVLRFFLLKIRQVISTPKNLPFRRRRERRKTKNLNPSFKKYCHCVVYFLHL